MRKLTLLLTIIMCFTFFTSKSQNISKEERQRRLELKKSGVSDDHICKYEKNEIDEFTKNKVVITEDLLLTRIGLAYGVSVKAIMVNDLKSLQLTIMSPSIFTIRENAEFMFMDSNKNVITLKAKRNNKMRKSKYFRFVKD